MSSPRSSDVRTLRRQVAALQHRVSWLERALQPKGLTCNSASSAARHDREQAEIQARMHATREYFDQRWLEYYKANPDQLKAGLENERKLSTFLRERGIEPRKSDLLRFAELLARAESK